MPQRSETVVGGFRLKIPEGAAPLGTRVFAGLVRLGLEAMMGLQAAAGEVPMLALSRVRGTGRGIHFGDYVKALEACHPIELSSPFEGSDLVAGGVWTSEIVHREQVNGTVRSSSTAALAKLRWSPGADDLPLHVHDHSDRFIIVLEGRGFFHVSGQTPADFDGTGVRSIPARERDVFVFTRGLLHTFSTAESPMTLLSCQMPYLPFDDPGQYRLPARRWTARENPEPSPPFVVCDPCWAYPLGGC